MDDPPENSEGLDPDVKMQLGESAPWLNAARPGLPEEAEGLEAQVSSEGVGCLLGRSCCSKRGVF